MENTKNTNTVLCFLAIIVSITLLFSGCGLMVRGAGKGYRKISHSSLFRQGRYGKLTKEETEWAKIAWKYFENNASPGAGMVNSVDGYPAMTLWHWADYLAALTSARELELIGKCEFDLRLSALLQSLNRMPLFNGELPNKLYHPQTGQMIDSAGKPGQTGWSAIDIGRFLTWLKIVKCRYPVYGEYIDKAVLRWNFCRVIDDCGVLYGSVKTGESIDIYQEGRLGYEEYAAKGFQLWGFNTRAASRIEPFKTIDIDGIRIPADARDPRETGASAPVLSMSYILPGLEFNWDRIDDNQSMDSRHTDKIIAEIADAVYRVQEKRYKKKRIFTARTDHHLPADPFFVFDSVYADGYPWNVLSPDGTYRKESSLVATRASFGMWALWKTEYTKKLISVVSCLYDPNKGWYEGRYETTGGYADIAASITNAAVLEALLYKSQGKIYTCKETIDHFNVVAKNEFERKNHCYPPARLPCSDKINFVFPKNRKIKPEVSGKEDSTDKTEPGEKNETEITPETQPEKTAEPIVNSAPYEKKQPAAVSGRRLNRFILAISTR